MTTSEKREELKEYLKKESLSQVKMAGILEITQQAVGALLNGKTPFGKGTAKKWEEKFGVRAAWLLTGEGEMLKGGGEVDPKRHGVPNRFARMTEAQIEDYIEIIVSDRSNAAIAKSLKEGEVVSREVMMEMLKRKDDKIEELQRKNAILEQRNEDEKTRAH